MELNQKELKYRRIDCSDISLYVDYRIMFLIELQGDQSPKKEKQLREELTEYFKHAIADKSYIGWIAEYNAKPVGFGGMVIQKIPGHFKYVKGLKGYILNMFTIPEYRRNGISHNILQKLILDGKKLGLNSIYLHATKDGIDLYRKEGFSEPDWPVLELTIES
ncbi:MAG: GNAT family N-acetyltransferase [Candidatus Cloacimonetes bacterium]|nr:GNAT family N-acetyltransferase [Candidatus Cloacimonadota bacterium]